MIFMLFIQASKKYMVYIYIFYAESQITSVRIGVGGGK